MSKDLIIFFIYFNKVLGPDNILLKCAKSCINMQVPQNNENTCLSCHDGNNPVSVTDAFKYY